MNTISDTVLLVCAFAGIAFSITLFAFACWVLRFLKLSPKTLFYRPASTLSSTAPPNRSNNKLKADEITRSIAWSRLSGVIMLVVTISLFATSSYLLLFRPNTTIRTIETIYTLALISFFVGSYFTVAMPVRLLLERTLHHHFARRHRLALDQPKVDLDRTQERDIEFAVAANRALVALWRQFLKILRWLIR